MVSRFKPMRGFIVAACAPYNNNGSVNVSVIPTYAKFLKESGASGVFVNGTQGESLMLSTEERIQIQSSWLQPDVRSLFTHVIVNVGTHCFSDLLTLAANASEHKADGIAVTVPSFTYQRPESSEHVIEYLDSISTHFPNLPMIFYNIASATPPAIFTSVHELIAKAGPRIPTLVGVKYTGLNLDDALMCQNNKDRPISVALGADDLVLGSYAMGIKAWIGATYTFSTKFCLKTLSLLDAGKLEEAQKHHFKLIRLCQAIKRYGLLRAFKHQCDLALTHHTGVSVGPVRLPLQSLTESEKAEIDGLMKDLDFEEIADMS